VPQEPAARAAAGQKRAVTINTAKGKIEVTVEGSLSPIAAGNFVALATCGFYNGVVFHRLVPDFVIQVGIRRATAPAARATRSRTRPVTAQYHRGTVARPDPRPNSGVAVLHRPVGRAARSLVVANTYAILAR